MIGFSMGRIMWRGGRASVILQIPIPFVPPMSRPHHQAAAGDWRFTLASSHGRRTSDWPGNPLHQVTGDPSWCSTSRRTRRRKGSRFALAAIEHLELCDIRAGWGSRRTVGGSRAENSWRTRARGSQDAGLDSLGVANAAHLAGVRHVVSASHGGTTGAPRARPAARRRRGAPHRGVAPSLETRGAR